MKKENNLLKDILSMKILDMQEITKNCICREMGILKDKIPPVIKRGYITMDDLIDVLDCIYSLLLLVMPQDILDKVNNRIKVGVEKC